MAYRKHEEAQSRTVDPELGPCHLNRAMIAATVATTATTALMMTERVWLLPSTASIHIYLIKFSLGETGAMRSRLIKS